MKDPYKVLGVDRGATEKAIQATYRKLAKQYHPDLHPGDKAAAERFKEIAAAYDLLSDPEKRGRYDRGEIDATGAERPSARGFQDFAEGAGRSTYSTASGISPEEFEEIFSRAFAKRGRSGPFSARGEDLHYDLDVEFLDAANGATRRLNLPDGRTLDVAIPAGLRDGQILRLKGQGAAGVGSGAAGDALIEVRVLPHRFFRREGNDVVVELPVTLKEAVLGAKVAVPTIKGSVTLTIPPNANSGTRLRLKERGIGGGHQFVDLKVVLPPEPEPELAAFLEKWKPKQPFEPRKGMERG
jgi:DnaJ-class molecular chaperone